MPTDTIKVSFHYKKSTKGTHVYQEVDQGGHPIKGDEATIGTLYVRRVAVGEDPPQRLEATISYEFKGDPA